MKVFRLLPLLLLCHLAAAQTTWYDGSQMGLGGKMIPTQNIYHRIDTSRYAFEGQECNLVMCSAGLTLHFKTNSKSIRLHPQYGYIYPGRNTNPISVLGFDLYIKQNGKWLWASSAVPGAGKEDKHFRLITDMDGNEHECLIYLPMYSEIRSLKVGLDEGASMEAIQEDEHAFKLGVYGSSFTMGSSTSRSGMSYPMQLARRTGLTVLPWGMSGNCKMQPAFTQALCDAQFDALLLDTFSNPGIDEIKERLFPFIEQLQAAHPGIPLIFQRTIYRETRNFNTQRASQEERRIEVADSLMKIACKKYKDVYYIAPSATSPDRDTSVDGVHPGDYGYTLWERSIEKPLLKILRKYAK